mmetsp:Transcript_16943/g.43205  ORF Transcript_16943/g.43205 Transcript_16943/m.43205 type:complete len:275 (-) Transcript_16943:303-1127(-)
MRFLLQGIHDFASRLELGRDGRHGLRDDERSPRFIDENRVCLVDQTEVEPLVHHHLVGIDCQVVPKVVKAKLGICEVHNLVFVGPLALFDLKCGLDEPNGDAEELQHLAHVFGITSCQIVIRSHDVDTTFLLQCSKECWQQCNDRLTLSSLHLRKSALVQHQPSQELNIEVPKLKDTPHSLAQHRKGIVDDGLVIHALLLDAPTKAEHKLAQLVVAHRLEFVLEVVDFLNLRSKLLQQLLVLLIQAHVLRRCLRLVDDRGARLCGQGHPDALPA